MSNLSTATKAKNKKLSALRQRVKMKAGAADLQKKIKAAVDASDASKQDFKDYNQLANSFPRAPQNFKDYNPDKLASESMPLPKSKPKKPAKKTAKKKESSGVIFDTTGTQPGKTIKGRKGGGMNAVPSKYEGFSKLPETVQEKISPKLAGKYKTGGMSKAVMKARGGTFKGTF